MIKTKKISNTALLILSILITLFSIQRVHAQSKDSLLRIYNNQTIQPSGNFFIVGGNRLRLGELKPIFMSSITNDLFKKAKNQRTIAGITTVAAIASLITGAVLKKQDKNGAWAFTIAGIGLNIWSFHLRKKSTELLDRAIWQRNKEILFGTTP